MAHKFDLLIKGGEVIDPSQGIKGALDVAFSEGKVASVAANIPASDAKEVYNAAGKIVTPGLVDAHCHFFYGVINYCWDSRKDLIPTGITCGVEGGAAGMANYYNLRDLIIKPAPLHLYAFLNIEALGQVAGRFFKTSRVETALVDKAVKLIERNKDTVVGIKVIMAGEVGGSPEEDLPLLKRGVEAARQTKTRVMVHIDGGTPMPALLDCLSPGDILTHAYHGNQPTVIGENGKVRPEVKEAYARGIIFDPSPAGNWHVAWKILEAATADGLWPQVITTDYAIPFPGQPMPMLSEVISMLMHVGMPIEKAIEASTINASKAIGMGDKHGTLKTGVCGDATVLEMETGAFDYIDMEKQTRTLKKRLMPRATIKSGKVAWQASATSSQKGVK